MENDDIMNYLIEQGGIEVSAVDENGEFLYSFTPKLKDILPELYNEHMNKVNSDISHFWELGFLNVDWFQENPMVTLTPKAFIPVEISKLSQEDQFALKEMKRVLLNKPLL